MNYLLTEAEENRLYAVRGQLRMLASLLDASSMMKTIETQCRPADISAFIDAQTEALSELIQATEARQETLRNAKAMSSRDWLYLIRIVSGEEDKTPGSSAVSIDRKLWEAALIDEDMRAVHSAWRDALALSGERRRLSHASMTAAPDVSAKPRRKREKLASVLA